MATAITWTGVTVNIQSAIAAGQTIVGITKADPGVVTCTAHGYSNDDYVRLTVQGMSQVDGRVFKIANVATDTFELVGEDTTAFDDFDSGTVAKPTLGTSISTITDLTASGGEPQYKATTTISDVIEKQISSAATAIEYSLQSIWDPDDAGLRELNKAYNTGATRVMRIRFRDGKEMLFDGTVTATLIPTGTAQDVVKTPAAISMSGNPTIYGLV